MQLNKRSYAYLAGMIDGDGGIYICKSMVNGCDTYQSQLCVASANRRLLNWLKHHFGGNEYKVSDAGDIPNFNRQTKEYYRTVDNYQWRLTGNKAVENVLSLIMPYLSIHKGRGLAAYNLTLLHGKYRASKERQECFDQHSAAIRNGTPEAEYKPSYFAGFFDADGSAGLVDARTPQSFRPLIRLSSNDVEILEWIQKSLGFGEIYSTIQDGELRYTWYFKTTDEKTMEKFLLSILPYLIVKREQVQTCLNLLRVLPNERTMERCQKDRQLLIQLNKPSCSLTTNTPACPENGQKIESVLTGDCESVLVVTQVA